jgi:arginyl-tRNA synthetase
MIPALLHPVLTAVAATVDPAAEVEPVAPTGNPAHGDYQWNFAFRMAKSLRMNPRALAEKLRPLIEEAAHPAIRKVEVAGPGFINLTLDDAWIARTLAAQVDSPAMGVAQVGAGRTAVVDFSSPNVAKRMHIGHMRSTHIGHALVSMHRAEGWTVVGDNHIGDWGTQFGKLIVAYRNWLDPEAFEADAIGELERIYVLFGDKAKEDPTLADQARAEIAKLQKGDAENIALWKRFIAISMAEFEGVYARLGVRFDEVLGESAYTGMTDAIVHDLLATSVAEHSEGAIIVRFENDVMIARKRDGADNYATSDLACVRYREDRWQPDRMIYVTDMRQQRHFQQFFEVSRRLGLTDADLVHAWFGMLVLPDGAISSTRGGNTIRLVDLLDEAVRRARAVVDAKSPQLSDEARAAIAEAVGVGAVRYADLSQHPQTNITFDWDRMLSLEGNTAPYLLYSYARAASVLAKARSAEEGGQLPDLAAIALGHPLERDLALALARYPELVAAATRGYRPNQLAEHLYEIAGRFNRFFHDCPVLKGGEARASRLALVEATRRVLRHGMELLGLTVLERM